MRSSLAAHVIREPASEDRLHEMRRKAWREQGIVTIRPDEIEQNDVWLAQALRNYAIKMYGRRKDI